MEPEQQIRINDLLLEREALFVRIYEIERKIEALVDAPYPFELPELPSAQRVKRKKAAKKVAKSSVLKLRPLEASERAYRVTYLQEGVEQVELVSNPKAVERIGRLSSTAVVLNKIETVDSSNETVEVLLSKSEG